MDATDHPSLRHIHLAERIARTGIDEAMVERLVRSFYDRVRADPLLGPVFAAQVDDWEPHLRTLMDFWSSVALQTVRYAGRPMPVHVRLDVGPEHFGRWLELFRTTAAEVCTPEAAAFFVGKAEQIARSFQMGIDAHRGVMRTAGATAIR